MLITLRVFISAAGLAAWMACQTAAAAPTHKVKKEEITSKVALKGVFVAQEMADVALQPDAWTQLKVLSALPAGANVKKGDQLVVLETDKLDEAITELQAAIELSTLGLRAAREEADVLEKALPLDLAAAKRSMETSDQDLLRFLKVTRQLSEKNAQVRVQDAENYLEYESEELRQLEKMYKADDLTEETEEIVLKRQRDSVDRLKFSLEGARIFRDQALQVDLPRQEESLKETARRNALNWEKVQEALPLALKQKRLELAKKESDHSQSEKRLSKLRRDREILAVKSPADGVVYYGACVNGRWQNQAAAAGKLRRGGALQESEVFMTIVKARPMSIVAPVPETELYSVRSGQKCEAVPTGYPDLKIAAEVGPVATVPSGGEGFDAAISLKGDAASGVMPGMTCAVKLESRRAALAVPVQALFQEGDKTFVYVVKGQGHEKRGVQSVKRSDALSEITEGLEEGDEILLEKPQG